jgi:thiamine-monophosphate kinase
MIGPPNEAARTEIAPHLTVEDIGEHALIDKITGRLSMPSWVVVGPGDDAAVLQPRRGALEVLTTDAQVEGVHFELGFVPPEAVGHRALAVSLSDLAAMGAEPRAALLSLAVPGTLEVAAVDRLLNGMLALATIHKVALVGGNVTRSPGPLMVDVAALGTVRPRRVLTRAGARPGDEVFVTGTLGEAAVGLRCLRLPEPPGSDGIRDAADGHQGCVERYLRPQPRVRAGMLLGRNRAATSCIDLSDGLGDGLRQIAGASGVGMVIEAASLPVGDGVRQWHERYGGDPVETGMSGGDDYELLFTVPPRRRGRLRSVRQQLGPLPIARIGVVTRERGLVLRDRHGARNLPEGFEHFR